MGRRELCICCFQLVTQAQLKKHAEEAARKERVIAMGGDPSVPDIPLRLKPITGNDIFPPRVPTPASASPVRDRTFYPESLPPAPPLPHPLGDGGRDLSPVGRTASFQRIRGCDTQTPAMSAERTLDQPTSTPLSPSVDPNERLSLVPPQSPSQDMQRSGGHPYQQPSSHVSANYELLDFAPGALALSTLAVTLLPTQRIDRSV